MAEIPYGYCQCGCGEKTKIIKGNQKGCRGRLGEPRRLIKNHSIPSQLLFWSHVDKSGECWLWTGAQSLDRNVPNYGCFRMDKKTVRAHRASWVISNGPIPDHLCVLHKCDNTLCVRPDHLFLGTHQDNMDDMAQKGRVITLMVSGANHPNAKLTECQIQEIRAKGEYMTRTAIAKEYGVSQPHICLILAGKTWK